MSDMNICIFTGRLTADPELRSTFTGKEVCNFSLAVNDQWTKDGEKKNNVTFINLTAWNGQVKFLTEYCEKGDFVRVTTRYTPQSYDKDGEKKTFPGFTVQEVQKLSWKKKDDDDNTTRVAEEKPKVTRTTRRGRDVPATEEFGDGEIPF